jgi:hypothetical protein
MWLRCVPLQAMQKHDHNVYPVVYVLQGKTRQQLSLRCWQLLRPCTSSSVFSGQPDPAAATGYRRAWRHAGALCRRLAGSACMWLPAATPLVASQPSLAHPRVTARAGGVSRRSHPCSGLSSYCCGPPVSSRSFLAARKHPQRQPPPPPTAAWRCARRTPPVAAGRACGGGTTMLGRHLQALGRGRRTSPAWQVQQQRRQVRRLPCQGRTTRSLATGRRFQHVPQDLACPCLGRSRGSAVLMAALCGDHRSPLPAAPQQLQQQQPRPRSCSSSSSQCCSMSSHPCPLLACCQRTRMTCWASRLPAARPPATTAAAAVARQQRRGPQAAARGHKTGAMSAHHPLGRRHPLLLPLPKGLAACRVRLVQAAAKQQ